MSTNKTVRPFFSAAKNHPEVIAHRGGGGEWPGETIDAFRQAIKLGVDVLEFDVRRTADDKIILMHNCTVNKTTDGKGRVRRMMMQDLKSLNAAARWATNPLFRNIPIPTLADALTFLKEHPSIRANIEIKPRDTWLGIQVGQMICAEGLQDRVLVASAWHRVLKKFRRKYPDIATSASVLEILAFQFFGKRFRGLHKPDAIQWHSKFFFVKIITRGFVERAGDMIIHAWTVNEPEEMGRMIELKVAGIITDHPTTLKKII